MHAAQKTQKKRKKVTHKVQGTVHVTNLSRKNSGVIYILSPPPLWVAVEEHNLIEFLRLCSTLSRQPYQLQHMHVKLQSWIQFFTLGRVYRRAFISLIHFASSGHSVPSPQLQRTLHPTGCAEQHLRAMWRWNQSGLFAGMASYSQYLISSLRTSTDLRRWCLIFKEVLYKQGTFTVNIFNPVELCLSTLWKSICLHKNSYPSAGSLMAIYPHGELAQARRIWFCHYINKCSTRHRNY